MRMDPITKEEFEPTTPEQVFINPESFLTFMEGLDPMETFEITKRKIDWEPIERKCRQCEAHFIADHPAMHYCELHRASQESEGGIEEKSEQGNKKRLAPLDHYKPRKRDCVSCGSFFMSTTPAMRYCENCSEKGGKIIKKT